MPGYYEIMEIAVRELLIEKKLIAPGEIRRQIEVLDSRTPALGAKLGLEVHAGHGLDYDTARTLARVPAFVEFNIGHFLVGEAIFIGLEEAIRRMRQAMDEGRSGR